MKRFLILILLALASPALAQEATLTAPIAKPSETRKVIGRVDLSRNPVYALIQVNVLDANGDVSRYYNVSVPQTAGDDAAHPSASVVSFVNAVMSSRAGETGGVARRFDYRVLGWLKDNGYLDDATVVP